ncbi:glycosyltransferase [Halobellus sp. GM3]|uniref:glycosyltransferase n=1 Tax=Halobellus sp. GM3 TaxID=3458410 RepID=UPI00403E0B2B
MTSVCVLTSAHPIDDTRIFHKQARTLEEDGYDVYLIAHHTQSESQHGIDIISVEDASSHLDRLVDLPKMYKIARDIDTDIYHFHDPGLLPVGAALAVRTDARVIYDCHEQYDISFRDYDFPPDVFNPFFQHIFPHVQSGFCQPLDAVIAATEWIQEDFEGLGHSSVQLVRNFPITENIVIDATGVNRTHDFVLVYVGGLTSTRGIHRMVEVLRLLREGGVDAGLWLLGAFNNAETERRTRNYIRDHELNDAVRFFGRVEHNEIFAYLAAADVGLALLDSGPYEYGVPTKMFEYMYAQIPVVASDTTANRAYLPSDCGEIVPYDDPHATASVLETLSRDSTLREEMGTAGRHRVETEYSWESERDSLLELYNRLTDQ